MMGLIQLYKTYGAEQISRIVSQFREHPPAELAGAAVEKIEDYQSGKRINLLTAQQEVIDLLSSNVLKFWLQDGSWFAICPSGTEPKVKFYFGVKEVTQNRSEKRLEEIQSNVMGAVENMKYNKKKHEALAACFFLLYFYSFDNSY